MNAPRTILCAAAATLRARLSALGRDQLTECRRAGIDEAEVRFIRLRLARPQARKS